MDKKTAKCARNGSQFAHDGPRFSHDGKGFANELPAPTGLQLERVQEAQERFRFRRRVHAKVARIHAKKPTCKTVVGTKAEGQVAERVEQQAQKQVPVEVHLPAVRFFAEQNQEGDALLQQVYRRPQKQAQRPFEFEFFQSLQQRGGFVSFQRQNCSAR